MACCIVVMCNMTRKFIFSEDDMSAIKVPVWEKSNLTLEEAAAYFNIGLNKLRDMTNSKAFEQCTLFIGNKRLIKRKLFERYLAGVYSI